MSNMFEMSELSPFGVMLKAQDSSIVSAANKDELLTHYRQDGLLVIRNVELSEQDQVELCSAFGPVLQDPREIFLVSNVDEKGMLGSQEYRFHVDGSFVAAPYDGASLYAIEVAEGVSATRFASGLSAYDRLPQRLRDRVEGLNALQVRTRNETGRTRLCDLMPHDLCCVHKVVGQQKGTGRPYLFVNGNNTDSIIGLSQSDSDALLEELLSYIYAAENIYEHDWKQGDIVIWDNLVLQHARREITGGNRTLRRVSFSELGFRDQTPYGREATDAALRRGNAYRSRMEKSSLETV